MISDHRTRKHKCLGELLQAARRAVGCTQAELAHRLGRPQSYVSKYEQGARRLDLLEFLEIAQALQIDALALMRVVADALNDVDPNPPSDIIS